MKITSMVLAASIALVPATAAMADDKKKEALAKAKEAAKEKAIEKAKEESAKKKEAAAAKGKEKAVTKDAGNDAAKQAAADAEKQTHARNLGAIERLQQIADATSDAALKTIVQRLSDKETKRHDLASAG